MPPEPFLIRDATLADIPAIAAIYRPEVEAGIATFEDIAPSEEEMGGRMTRLVAQGLPYIVAERQGAVIGFAYAGPYHPRSAYRYTVEDTVYIRPDTSRQGVGRGLLSELIARSEKLGFRQMIALITTRPDSASIALHSALGFRLIGIAEAIGFKFGKWRDMTYMQRPIGMGASISPNGSF